MTSISYNIFTTFPNGNRYNNPSFSTTKHGGFTYETTLPTMRITHDLFPSQFRRGSMQAMPLYLASHGRSPNSNYLFVVSPKYDLTNPRTERIFSLKMNPGKVKTNFPRVHTSLFTGIAHGRGFFFSHTLNSLPHTRPLGSRLFVIGNFYDGSGSRQIVDFSPLNPFFPTLTLSRTKEAQNAPMA